MAKNLLDQAQICEDDFYQQYRPAEGFFTLNDFAIRVRDVRDRLLDNEFLILWNRNKKIEINPQWLSHVFPEVKKDEQDQWYAEICEPLYEFPRDSVGEGIQDVSGYGEGCSEFIPITNPQAWSICLLPPTQKVYYSLEGCRILLYNFFGCCDKLDARVVLSQSGLPFERQTVPDGKASEIRQIVMAEMFTAYQQKLGKLSAHNDGNPNQNPNETSHIFDGLKTK